MEIYAGVIYFNDGAELFRKCLMALKDLGFRTIAIDGAYRNFPLAKGEHVDYSSDGCREIAEELAWLAIPAPIDGWPNQAIKRSKYFEIAPVGKYLMMADADEVVRPFNVEEVFTGAADDAYQVSECRHTSATASQTMGGVRVYKVYSDLRYLYQHCRIYRIDQHNPKILDSGIVAMAHGPLNASRRRLPITLDHWKYLRPADRVARKEKFYSERPEVKFGY